MSDDDTLPERALNHARQSLIEAGNPAWTTLVELPGGSFASGPLIVARVDQAKTQAQALAEAAPGRPVLHVGLERADRLLRFTVLDADGKRLLRRDETQERPIGDRLNETI